MRFFNHISELEIRFLTTQKMIKISSVEPEICRFEVI